MIGDCGHCIHFERCSVWHKEFIGKPLKVESLCEYFKNKADFVEVVRCKDCANILHKNDISVVCKILGKVMITEDYCSYGAKKNDFKE